MDNVVKASRDYVNEAPNHARKDNIVQFARGKVLLSIGNNDYSAEVIVGTTKNNDMVLYDIINLTPTKIKKKARLSVTDQLQNAEIRRSNNPATQTVPQTKSSVKPNDQLSIDLGEDDLLGFVELFVALPSYIGKYRRI